MVEHWIINHGHLTELIEITHNPNPKHELKSLKCREWWWYWLVGHVGCIGSNVDADGVWERV